MVGLQRIDYSRPRLMLQCRSQYLYLAPPCLDVQGQFHTPGRAGVSVQCLSSTGAQLSPCCYAQLITEDTATSVKMWYFSLRYFAVWSTSLPNPSKH